MKLEVGKKYKTRDGSVGVISLIGRWGRLEFEGLEKYSPPFDLKDEEMGNLVNPISLVEHQLDIIEELEILGEVQ